MKATHLLLITLLCVGACDDSGSYSASDEPDAAGDSSLDADDDAAQDLGGDVEADAPGDGCVQKVTVGTRFACALTRNDEAWCWGSGDLGQLGQGSLEDSAVPGRTMEGVTEVVAGCQHACALANDGTVWCWGRNASGNLGSPGVQMSTTPVQVVTEDGEPFTDVTTVAAGCAYTCAVRGDETVWCWGQNNTSQLGNGTLNEARTPVQVLVDVGGTPFVGATALAGGGFHTCARKPDGSLWCWGRNDFGHLGNGTGEDSAVAVRADIEDVVEVSVGFSHSCARTSAGVVSCWGMVDDPLAGPGSVALNSALPQEVFTGASHVFVEGSTHICAIGAEDALSCWGRNNLGQLGDGTTEFRPQPVKTLLAAARSGGAAQLNTCAVTPEGTLFCWGDGERGQLGPGHEVGSPEPVQIELDCD